jgi:hypothetical protein
MITLILRALPARVAGPLAVALAALITLPVTVWAQDLRRGDDWDRWNKVLDPIVREMCPFFSVVQMAAVGLGFLLAMWNMVRAVKGENGRWKYVIIMLFGIGFVAAPKMLANLLNWESLLIHSFLWSCVF